jgi:hypothetical protein
MESIMMGLTHQLDTKGDEKDEKKMNFYFIFLKKSFMDV